MTNDNEEKRAKIISIKRNNLDLNTSISNLVNLNYDPIKNKNI